jgi:hypothetical protein
VQVPGDVHPGTDFVPAVSPYSEGLRLYNMFTPGTPNVLDNAC